MHLQTGEKKSNNDEARKLEIKTPDMRRMLSKCDIGI
jgi:hypothetical protein